MKSLRYSILSALFLLSFTACKLFAPSVSPFDSYAYVQTTSLKVDALHLMDEATEDYQSHEKEISLVQTNMQKVYEYEKHRPKNEFTTKQWEILLDSTGHLFGGFIIKWRAEARLNAVYIHEKKKQIAIAFDQIAELESKKIKQTDIKP